MLADGRFDPDPLVTSRLPLEAVADGFEALLDENSDEVKVLVES
jgi:threonine dehydrogenase-like Zn-dependent dehydrogenase